MLSSNTFAITCNGCGSNNYEIDFSVIDDGGCYDPECCGSPSITGIKVKCRYCENTEIISLVE